VKQIIHSISFPNNLYFKLMMVGHIKNMPVIKQELHFVN
jgi:hypothetical protein